MADRHPRDRHTSKPYSQSASSSKPRGPSRTTPISTPQHGGGKGEFEEGSSRGPSIPAREQRLATPSPERPVCLVRGSLYIEDYIEGKVRRHLSCIVSTSLSLPSARPRSLSDCDCTGRPKGRAYVLDWTRRRVDTRLRRELRRRFACMQDPVTASLCVFFC